MELEGVGPQLYTVAENKAKIRKTCEEKESLRRFSARVRARSILRQIWVQDDTFHLPVHVEAPYDISKD